MKKLWVTAKVNNKPDLWMWEFIGVFDSESKAVAACRDDNYFVGPVELNEQLPDEPIAWVGGYYPLAKGG